MIVCVCKAVNARAIRQAVAAGIDTFDGIQVKLGVGTCCGKCVSMACEVLCDARLEAHGQHTQPAHSPLRFVPSPSSREVALA